MNNLLLPLRQKFREARMPGPITPVIQRWERGEEPDTFAALEEHPEWRADKVCVLDLAYEEYCIRLARGEELDTAEFCARFPAHRTSLLQMILGYAFLDENPDVVEKATPVRWPEAGETLDDLTLLRELGRGTFARVFLASEASTGGRVVAVKFTCDGQHEAWTLGPLNHDNIVQVLSAGSEPTTGLSVVRMPYHGPSTLEDLIDRAYPQSGALPPRRAGVILETARADAAVEVREPPAPVLLSGSFEDGVAWLIGRMAAALAFLHERGICHRDLKPTNVLLSPSGQPLLLDFNLSADGRVAASRLGGTLPYMAPEQLRAMTNPDLPSSGPEADVFALGVIAHELLTGRHPFGPVPRSAPLKELAELLLERQQHGSTVSLFRGDGRLGRSLERLLGRCLAADPAARPTAAQLQSAVLAYFRPVQRCRRWFERRPIVALATAAVLLVLTVSGVNWLRQAAQAAPVPIKDSDDKSRAAEQFERGRQQLAKNDRSTAYGLFQESNRLSSEGGRALACMAYLRALGKLHQEALNGWNAALAAGFRPSAELHNNRGYSAMMLYEAARKTENREAEASRWYDTAQADFNEAIRLNPKLQAPYLNRSLLVLHRQLKYPGQEFPDQAVDDVGQALRLGPVSAGLACDAARVFILVSARRPELKEEALQFLKQAIEKGFDPNYLQYEQQLFAPLKNDPRFQELLKSKPRAVSVIPQIEIVDPIPLKSR